MVSAKNCIKPLNVRLFHKKEVEIFNRMAGFLEEHLASKNSNIIEG
jgi:hypothetical protein